jgi:endonuclease YncB( thermonuclease family)/uncharacterized membrane protein YkvA (DUF1232 family)
VKRLRRLWRRVGPARLGTLLLALWKLARHPTTPWYCKAVAAAVVAYAVSPIDLVPDFIPLLGQLDDLVLIPLGLALAVRLAPPAVWQACLRAARAQAGRVPRLLWGAVAVVVLWVALVGALVLALASAVAAAPREVAGTVARVVDGDTLVFRSAASGEPDIAVRLRGIDAPESCQAWGAQARQALRQWAEGREAVLQVHGQDDYRRTLAVVRIGGEDLNRRLVLEGHAWAYLDRGGRGIYTEHELQARAALRGLHANPAAQPPWDFRREHGRCRR